MNTRQLEVLFAPCEQDALAARSLGRTVCVVFDILRFTSTLVTALANGAESVLPVREIPEALDAKARDPDALLAGERHGIRIGRELTGGLEFDFGNSPSEFTRERVQGKPLIATTTNGTRALVACRGASSVLVGSFLNLAVTAAFVERLEFEDLILVCSGTENQAAMEDVIAAGAFADLLWGHFASDRVTDSARMARSIYLLAAKDLEGALGMSRNGKRLLGIPELARDVALCGRRDIAPLVAGMVEGRIRQFGDSKPIPGGQTNS